MNVNQNGYMRLLTSILLAEKNKHKLARKKKNIHHIKKLNGTTQLMKGAEI